MCGHGFARQISDSLIGPADMCRSSFFHRNGKRPWPGRLSAPPEDRQLALGQEKLREFLDRIRIVVDSAVQAGEKPVLLTSMQVRYHVHSIVDRIRMNVPVIAQAEIHRRARVKVVGTI